MEVVDTSDAAGLYGPEVLIMVYQIDNSTKAIENMAQHMTIAMHQTSRQLMNPSGSNSNLSY
jgi:hypothetical protein